MPLSVKSLRSFLQTTSSSQQKQKRKSANSKSTYMTRHKKICMYTTISSSPHSPSVSNGSTSLLSIPPATPQTQMTTPTWPLTTPKPKTRRLASETTLLWARSTRRSKSGLWTPSMRCIRTACSVGRTKLPHMYPYRSGQGRRKRRRRKPGRRVRHTTSMLYSPSRGIAHIVTCLHRPRRTGQ